MIIYFDPDNGNDNNPGTEELPVKTWNKANELSINRIVYRDCPDCGVEPGKFHIPGCDVEQCPFCGGQLISCNCCYEKLDIDPYQEPIYSQGLNDEQEVAWNRLLEEVGLIPWSGEWPGKEECREFNLWSFFGPNGWTKCDKNYPGASEALNRLHIEYKWSQEKKRFIKR